ncbi:MAG: cytochrome C [Desulfuromonas sp.]|nr:cytochrome C [Desulfuromonas sp.]
MKRSRLVCSALLLAGIFLIVSLPVSAAGNKGVLQGLHALKSKLPKGCRSCHQGMTMLVTGEETSCLPCHGNSADRERMVRDGYLKQTGRNTLADIEAELRKIYAHPTLTDSGVHQSRETLPEEVGNAARHAECVDCHNPHLVDAGMPLRGVLGKRTGNFSGAITKEYELCYKCHAESANLPGNSTNKHAEFKTTNPSFHPVEGEGKSSFVISLKEPYVVAKGNPNEISEISCRDCHGSDDPASPKGPHGSNIEGLLVLDYQKDDALPESSLAYALCYKCHERNSILADESFPYHSLHIVGRTTGQGGTSCYTCHDAHGSLQYPHLIRFNEEVVQKTKDDQFKYDARGYTARHGSCYLNCHGVEHNPKEY